MGASTAAGSTFAIGPQNSTASSQNDYEALTYTTVGEVTTKPEIGGTQFQDVTYNPLATRRVLHFKGSKDSPVMEIMYAHDSADTGQADLSTALDSDEEYAFRVQLNDAGTGSPSSPTTWYVRGKVMAIIPQGATSDDIIMETARIQPTSDPVKVDAV